MGCCSGVVVVNPQTLNALRVVPTPSTNLLVWRQRLKDTRVQKRKKEKLRAFGVPAASKRARCERLSCTEAAEPSVYLVYTCPGMPFVSPYSVYASSTHHSLLPSSRILFQNVRKA